MSTLALARRKASLRSIMAVLAAAATAVTVYSYLSWLRSQIPIAGKLVPLVFAAQDIEAGTLIDRSMLRVGDHPEKYLPVGAISSVAALTGKAAAIPIFLGEAITDRKIGKRGGTSSIVPKGMRAYSVAVGSGLGFAPKPGDRVDVIVTFPREVLGEPTSMTILRGTEVAAVSDPASRNRGQIGAGLGLEGVSDGFGITLFVTSDEAQRLAMAEALGRITVVLAPASKDETATPNPVRPGDLSKR